MTADFYKLRYDSALLRDEILRTRVRQETERQTAGRPSLPDRLIITSSEITERQATGILLARAFTPDQVFNVVSRVDYGGATPFAHIQISHRTPDPQAAKALQVVLETLPVRQALVLPHFPDEVHTALALRKLSPMPLVTWMMDDPVFGEKRMSKALLQELFAVSDICFVISPEMRDFYQREFQREFFVIPPLVSKSAMDAPPVPQANKAGDRICAMMGSLWNPDWLQRLKAALPGSGWKMDWFARPANLHESLESYGIIGKGFLPEVLGKDVMPAYPFTVIPTGTGGEDDIMRSLTLLSLPSRVVFLFAICRAPLLVFGSEDSCAAKFVRRLGIGLCCSYDPADFAKACERLCDPAFNAECRRNCDLHAPDFVGDGVAEWIWESAILKKPASDRFEHLFS